jgi:hypothetical protein
MQYIKMNVAVSGCCNGIRYPRCLSGIGGKRVQLGGGGRPMIRDRVCRAVTYRNNSGICDDIRVGDERDAMVPGGRGERGLMGTSQVRVNGFLRALEWGIALKMGILDAYYS